MWKVEALFQGNSPTCCLLLRSFVSCEEDERSEGNISAEQRIIIKFLMKESCKPSEICSRLKRRYGEKTLSSCNALNRRGLGFTRGTLLDINIQVA